MNNGITEQLRGLQHEKQQLEQLLSDNASWCAYQEFVAAQPYRKEKDIIHEIGLPENLARELDDNRLFQARLKILDAIDLLTNLVANTDTASDQASFPPEPEVAEFEVSKEHQEKMPNEDLPQQEAMKQEVMNDECEVEPLKSPIAATGDERLINEETKAETPDDFGLPQPAMREAPFVGSHPEEQSERFSTLSADGVVSGSGVQSDVDDLTRIDGIDRNIALQLRSQGVKTFADIAGWTLVDLAVISSTLKLGNVPHEQDWIGQAARLCQSGAAEPPIPEGLDVPETPDRAGEAFSQSDNPENPGLDITHQDFDKALYDADDLAMSILPLLTCSRTAGLSQPAASVQIASHQHETEAACDAEERVSAVVGQSDIPGHLTAAMDELVANSVIAEPILEETAANDDQPDDLRRIKGLTDADYAMLVALNFSSFAALASASAHDVKYLKASLMDGGRLHKEQWIEQAAILAQGKLTYFAQRQIYRIVPTTLAMPAEQAWVPLLPPQSKEAGIEKQPVELVSEALSQELECEEKNNSVEDQAVSIAKMDTQEDNVREFSEYTSTDQDGIALSPDPHLETSSEDGKMATYTTQPDAWENVLSEDKHPDRAAGREAAKSDRQKKLIQRKARNESSQDKEKRQASAPVHRHGNPPKANEPAQQRQAFEHDATLYEENIASVKDRMAAASSLQDRLDATDVDADGAQVDASISSQDLAIPLNRYASGRDKNRLSIARYAFAAEEASVQIVRRDNGTSIDASVNEQSVPKEKTKSNLLAVRFLGALRGRDKK